MRELVIKKDLWQEFVTLARRLRRSPLTLAETALRDCMQRLEDEELLDASARAARRTGLQVQDVEDVIRRHRRQKVKNPGNGRTEKTDARRR